MIPEVNNLLNTTLEIRTLPSKNYMMQIETERVRGYCDKKEAVKQAIYKILNTERYQYIIYSWNYGITLTDLFGKPVNYACAEIERRVKDALYVDDRIMSCTDFEFDTGVRHVVGVTFIANTVFGDVKIEKAVSI